MYHSEKTINNPSGHDLEVIIEPWGMDYTLRAGAGFTIIARSEQVGELEMDGDSTCVVVWVWPGSTCELYQDGELIQDFPIKVPQTPKGMSTRQFLEMILDIGG